MGLNRILPSMARAKSSKKSAGRTPTKKTAKKATKTTRKPLRPAFIPEPEFESDSSDNAY